MEEYGKADYVKEILSDKKEVVKKVEVTSDKPASTGEQETDLQAAVGNLKQEADEPR